MVAALAVSVLCVVACASPVAAQSQTITMRGARYRLGAHIGGGGQARIFRARSSRTARAVAVRISRDLDHLTERRQAAMAVRTSPWFVHHVEDTQVEAEDGSMRQVEVMELLEDHVNVGPTWDVQRRPERLHDALEIGRNVLRGLATLHRAGFIHRDVRAHNVMIGKTLDPASVRIIDLGSVRRIDTTRPRRTPDVDLLDATALIVGLVTGEVPTLFRHPRDEARVARVLGRIGDDRLRAVLARGVDADPARRYRSAQELLTALEAFP